MIAMTYTSPDQDIYNEARKELQAAIGHIQNAANHLLKLIYGRRKAKRELTVLKDRTLEAARIIQGSIDYMKKKAVDDE